LHEHSLVAAPFHYQEFHHLIASLFFVLVPLLMVEKPDIRHPVQVERPFEQA
jgi:hypothetical protein